MNERIFTELYKKAWGHFPCPTGEPELEKFAELIVRECIEAIQNKSMNASDEWEVGLLIAEFAIKKHFGVE